MIEMGHPQVQVPFKAQSIQDMEKGHGVGSPGNRHQDSKAGHKELFGQDKAAYGRQQEARVDRLKERLD